MPEQAQDVVSAAARAPRLNQTIELDCEPGGIRPGDLIAGVIMGTGLDVREPVSMWFGEWTWDYSDIPAEEWTRIRAITKPRVEQLYHAGMIRYGSW